MQRVGYSSLQIVLHWLVAALVLFNYLYSEGMGRAFDAMMEGGASPNLDINPNIHVWVGVSVLVLVLIRLVVRLASGAPKAGEHGLVQTAAEWGHRLIYLLLIAVPVLGAATWFGGIEATGDIHGLVANGLMIVAGLHALIALWHQFVVKDGVLTRMFIPGRG